jgi:hypothetical protein
MARFRRPAARSSSTVRNATAAILALRVGYGLALLAAPAKVAGNRWLGPEARQAAAQVPLRGLGGREVAVHGLALVALFAGADVRPWLAASIAGDLSDIGVTVLAREGLPDGSAAATAAVAGGSALLSAAAAALADD